MLSWTKPPLNKISLKHLDNGLLRVAAGINVWNPKNRGLEQSVPLKTDQVWNEFSDSLRGFILKRVGDSHYAEEILQEAFLKIHKNLDKLQGVNHLRPWLYQIVRNTIADYYRTRRPAKELQEGDPQFAEEASVDTAPSEEISPCIKALVDRLPELDRATIKEVEFEGMSQKELSEKLGISVSGAKSRVQRARGRLRNMLLECCSFELDRKGNVLDYRPKASPLSECCKEESEL